ncbi:predicted protein [Nematostella vectensis]|uniref:Elongation factor Ts, mitochondrial n=1 Tax=Nematostella vectensis TaxID=45351 RepID=EFTS_NEMVE|nr:RecName: Full=Elongation factor Ts, mitochondrial; Short=EF-Ts; Short=EF-TsMt [Nematostella vectensis]EDO34261.1 predicted protein [Nematostella vectensis]|eukprot:XP_001626361.1 predicted protein [Nematostella vectensis]
MDKSLLGKLRKETGFGFSKCREALVLARNDYAAAEAWLHEQAEKEGWQKANKLQGRSATEGLIGVIVNHSDMNLGAMVEVNCETDFVARNENFVDLVNTVTSTTLAYRRGIIQRNQKLNMFGDQVTHLREFILTHELSNLRVEHNNPDSMLLSDMVAKVIGKLGENIKLGKAITITTDSDNVIGSYVHGPYVTKVHQCSFGKYGAMVAVKPIKKGIDTSSLALLANKLAQHVVGMNPKVIGQGGEADEKGGESEALLDQEYLLDGSLTVGQFTEKEGVQVVDFVRYECGAK